MPVLCESRVSDCKGPARVRVTFLAPTGETITTDTGTAPVLKPLLTLRLCYRDAREALGASHFGHVDTEDLDPDEVLELDGLTLAKMADERSWDRRRASVAGTVNHRTVKLPAGVRTWAR